MSPSSREREREYAKRRLEKWNARQRELAAARRRARRNALVAIATVVAVVAVVVGVTVVAGRDDGSASAAASPSASASPSDGATASPSASPSGSTSAAANPCGKPPAKPAKPEQFDAAPAPSLAAGRAWNLAIETSCGPVGIRLDGAKAPKAVANAIFLAREGFWDGTPCHRLTTSGIFVLQCGDPTGLGTGGPGYEFGPVENAPADGTYPAGTVAMARQGGKGDSMGSQFFLVYEDSKIPSDAAGGYTVIGKIVGGLGTVAKVAAGGAAGGGGDGAPVRAVSITSTTVTPA